MSGLGASSMWDLFRGEVESQMKAFTDGLLALEAGDPPAEHLASAMRAAHSIKGAARIVQLDSGVRLSHVMEDCLVAAQESGLSLHGGGIDVLLSAGDLLSRLSVVNESAVPQWLEEHAGLIDQLCDQLAQVRAGTWTPSVAPAAEAPAAVAAYLSPVPEALAPPVPEAPAPPAGAAATATTAPTAEATPRLPAVSADVPEQASVFGALLFEVAGQRYGLDISRVVEVVPAVHLRTIPGVPAHVTGLCRYRGSLVPVLDLSQMLGGPPSVPRYSTRLVIVQHKGPAGQQQLLGLLAEGAAHGVTASPRHLTSSGIATPETPYLGKLATDGEEIFQLVTVDQLIPDGLRERLFAEP